MRRPFPFKGKQFNIVDVLLQLCRSHTNGKISKALHITPAFVNERMSTDSFATYDETPSVPNTNDIRMPSDGT